MEPARMIIIILIKFINVTRIGRNGVKGEFCWLPLSAGLTARLSIRDLWEMGWRFQTLGLQTTKSDALVGY